MDAVHWVAENWDDLVQLAGLLLAAVSLVVKLTPSPKDDEWLKRVLARLSALHPKGAGGLKLPGSKYRGSDE